MNVQPRLLQSVSQSRKNRPSKTGLREAKPRFTVSLTNRGNPDIGQAPTQPLPSSRCYKKTVCSLLEARRLCLNYIQDYQLGGSNWCGGLVTNEQGQAVAQVSYNGRIWEPTIKPLEPKKPYPPLLTYDYKQGLLTICYSHVYKEMRLRAKELTGEFRFMNPLNDNQGLLVTLQPVLAEGLIKVSISPTQYQGSQGWLTTTDEPLAEGTVEFIN